MVAPYSTDNRSILYDSRPIIHRQSMVNLTYRPSVGRYIDRDIGRRSVDTSIDTQPICRSTYRPTYRPTYLGRYIGRGIGRYVDRHSGRVSVDISTDTSVEILISITRELYLNIFEAKTELINQRELAKKLSGSDRIFYWSKLSISVKIATMADANRRCQCFCP